MRIQEQMHNERLQKYQQETERINADTEKLALQTERIKNAKMTPEQKAHSDTIAQLYFAALAQTISNIDDGKTSPDVVAKAAVAANLDRLNARYQSQMIHISESSTAGANAVKERAAKLPHPSDIDDAIYIVLRLRQKPSTDEPKQLQPSDIPAQPSGSPNITI